MPHGDDIKMELITVQEAMKKLCLANEHSFWNWCHGYGVMIGQKAGERFVDMEHIDRIMEEAKRKTHQKIDEEVAPLIHS